MLRYVKILLIVGLLLSFAGMANAAQNHHRVTPYQARHSRYANYLYCGKQDWHKVSGAYNLAYCNSILWRAPWVRVRCILTRESGGNWSEVNRSSGASGFFQFVSGTWDYYFPRFKISGLHDNVLGGTANAVVAIRMMAAGLWSHWASYRNPC